MKIRVDDDAKCSVMRNEVAHRSMSTERPTLSAIPAGARSWRSRLLADDMSMFSFSALLLCGRGSELYRLCDRSALIDVIDECVSELSKCYRRNEIHLPTRGVPVLNFFSISGGTQFLCSLRRVFCTGRHPLEDIFLFPEEAKHQAVPRTYSGGTQLKVFCDVEEDSK